MTSPTASAAPHFSLALCKQTMRHAALARRAGLDPALGTRLVDHALPLVPGAGLVAGFWPLPGEIDIRPLLRALHGRGHALALPRTPPRGAPLSFHLWSPGEALLPGRFGTAHPAGAAVIPAVLLVPLLAFDGAGRRLGYGGGYYDRTLAALPGALAIGCAYAAQQVDCVPAGPHDIPLAAVVTERGVIHPA